MSAKQSANGIKYTEMFIILFGYFQKLHSETFPLYTAVSIVMTQKSHIGMKL